MRTYRKAQAVFATFAIASMLLGACASTPTPAPAATEPAATATTEVVATTAPADTQPAVSDTATPAEPTATAEPVHTTRHGGWLDEIDYSVVAADSAVSQVKAGAIDIFTFGLASSELQSIKDSGLSYSSSYGGNYAIMLNPAVFKDANTLNPFSDRKIREALNWLIDRNYINQEVYSGGSVPKFSALTTQLPEYTGVVDIARALETKYAYNLEQAKTVISAEMTTLGATAGADGKWQFKGKPVSLAFLIRSDGDGTRKPTGDYVATQLEAAGFTVDRQYKKSSEASPIWIGTDPVEGKWNLYTAGWLPAGLTRDEKNQFQQMYLPDSQQGIQPFLSNVPDPDFQKVGDDLANGAFNTPEERHALIEKALTESLQDSLQVWTIDTKTYSPYQNNVEVSYDLAAGIESANVAPYTMRFTDKEGGQMKVGTNDLFTEPWNPVAGSNWVWDAAVMRSTASYGIMADPFTGLAWPQRIATAEVTVQTGLPVVKNLDWVTLKTADKIDVPADALLDWDAKAQKFIPAGDGVTAKVKSVVTYPADLLTTVKWQDGSPLSVADFVMPLIMTFDRANKDSAIYDPAAEPFFQSFKSSFKGFRITSTSPLTIEYYSDTYNQDAELNVTSLWPSQSFGLSGDNAWDVLTVSNLAEAGKELAYTPDQADANKVEQTSYVGGPSLDILSKYLDKADGESYIPYAATLGQYITAADAKTRYDNLKAWYTAHGHFWVGTGPYYIDKVFTTEKTLVLKNNADFVDLSDRWNQFSEPKLADAALDGPTSVTIGDEVTFDVTVTFKGNPYPQADVKQVKYLLYDATGAVVSTGDAKAVEDGHYQVVLGADVTGKLVAGSDKLEVAVVPIPVAIPAFTSVEFVVTP
jgi:peptide/nickel transport system substrate-binding protein